MITDEKVESLGLVEDMVRYFFLIFKQWNSGTTLSICHCGASESKEFRFSYAVIPTRLLVEFCEEPAVLQACDDSRVNKGSGVGSFRLGVLTF